MANSDEIENLENASSEVATLIEECVLLYGDDLAVIRDQGEYPYILKLTLAPEVVVSVMVSDVSRHAMVEVLLKLNPNVPVHFREHFNREITELKSTNDIQKLLHVAVAWWSTNRDSIANEIVTIQKTKKIEKRQKQKGSNKKPTAIAGRPLVAEPEPEPQCSRGMKTAEDVVHRILWDPQLKTLQDDFVVGYVDRFSGVQEKLFSAFNWANFSEVDPDESAVPRHRIQYFRYKKVKVWDRPLRVDLVFGSAGNSTQTLHDVIRSEDERDGSAVIVEQAKDQDNEEEEEFEDDPNGDEEYLPIDQNVALNLPNDVTPGDRPSHYLALQIRDAAVLKRLGEVQQSLCEQCPKYVKQDYLEKMVEQAHVTLALFKQDQLTSVGGMRTVAECVERVAPKLRAILKTATLKLSGLQLLHRYRVVVANLEPDQVFLQQIQHALNEAFLDLPDGYYAPTQLHLTILKLRPVARDQAKAYQPLSAMCSVSRFRAAVANGLALTLKPVGRRNVDVQMLRSPIEKTLDSEEPDSETPSAGCSNDGPSRPIGVHVKNAYQMEGFHDAIYAAASVGSRAAAFFLSNKGKWEIVREPSHDEIEKFKLVCQQCDIPGHRIVVHGPYVLAPGSADEEIRQRSVNKIIEDLRVCGKLGIAFYNIHVDTHGGSDTSRKPMSGETDRFLDRVIESVNEVLTVTTDECCCGVSILLETSAGQGGERGGRFSELRTILDGVATEHRNRIGVCIDTCHIFAAGYDMSTSASYGRTMNLIQAQIGWQNVKAFHLNDSKCTEV